MAKRDTTLTRSLAMLHLMYWCVSILSSSSGSSPALGRNFLPMEAMMCRIRETVVLPINCLRKFMAVR